MGGILVNILKYYYSTVLGITIAFWVLFIVSWPFTR